MACDEKRIKYMWAHEEAGFHQELVTLLQDELNANKFYVSS